MRRILVLLSAVLALTVVPSVTAHAQGGQCIDVTVSTRPPGTIVSPPYACDGCGILTVTPTPSGTILTIYLTCPR